MLLLLTLFMTSDFTFVFKLKDDNFMLEGFTDREGLSCQLSQKTLEDNYTCEEMRKSITEKAANTGVFELNRTVEWILAFYAQHGFLPTQETIAVAMGLSRSAITKHYAREILPALQARAQDIPEVQPQDIERGQEASLYGELRRRGRPRADPSVFSGRDNERVGAPPARYPGSFSL